MPTEGGRRASSRGRTHSDCHFLVRHFLFRDFVQDRVNIILTCKQPSALVSSVEWEKQEPGAALPSSFLSFFCWFLMVFSAVLAAPAPFFFLSFLPIYHRAAIRSGAAQTRTTHDNARKKIR